MNNLEALNVAMEKTNVRTALKISVGGKWHTVTIDRDDKNIQKTVRVLVSMMLRAEVDKVVDHSEKLRDYNVRVYPSRKNITVRAHSPLDARVGAFILAGNCPNKAEPQVVIDLAYANTEIMT